MKLKEALSSELEQAKARRAEIKTRKEVKEMENAKIREIKANERFEVAELKRKGITKQQHQHILSLKHAAMMDGRVFDEAAAVAAVVEEDKKDSNLMCCVCQTRDVHHKLGKASCGHVICKRCVTYLGAKCPICDGTIRAADKLVETLSVDISQLTGKALREAYREKRKIIMAAKERELEEQQQSEVQQEKSLSIDIKEDVQKVRKNDFYQKLRVRVLLPRELDEVKGKVLKIIAANAEPDIERKKVTDAEMDDIMEALGGAGVQPRDAVCVVNNVIQTTGTTSVDALRDEIKRQAKSKRNQKLRLAEKLAKQEQWEQTKANERRDMTAKIRLNRIKNRTWKLQQLEDGVSTRGLDELAVGIVGVQDGKRVRYVREFVKRPSRIQQPNRETRDMVSKPCVDSRGNVVHGLVESEFSIPLVEEEVCQPRVRLGPLIKHQQFASITDLGQIPVGNITGERKTSVVYQAALVRGDGGRVAFVRNAAGKIDLPHVHVQTDWELVDVLETLAEIVPEWNPAVAESFEFKGKTMFILSSTLTVGESFVDMARIGGVEYTGLIYDWSRLVGYKGTAPMPSARKVAKREAYCSVRTLDDAIMRCPLTERRVDNPVLCNCSKPHRFEGWALRSYIEQHGCCPRDLDHKMKLHDIQQDTEGEADLVKRRGRKDIIKSVQAITQLEIDSGKSYRPTRQK